ncbi:MAG: hypothetical protein HYV32_03630 [Candidatus Kerfeldbacteria bacterium]|nr:hypothetical protein [Candidatus Kerfeldbacteria bacterium]
MIYPVFDIHSETGIAQTGFYLLDYIFRLAESRLWKTFFGYHSHKNSWRKLDGYIPSYFFGFSTVDPFFREEYNIRSKSLFFMIVMFATAQFIILLVALVGNITNGIYLLVHKNRNTLSYIFGLVCLQAASWNASIFLAFAMHKPEEIHFFLSLAFLSVSAIPSTYLLFSKVFIGQHVSLFRGILIFTIPLLMLPAIFTSWNIRGYHGVVNAAYFIPGPLYIIYTIYFFIFMGLAKFYLFHFYKTTEDRIKRYQLTYILPSVIISGIIGVALNGILPLFFDGRYMMLGSASTIFFVVATSYAITRYRFMNIHVVLRKSVVYGGTIVSCIAFIIAIGSFVYIRTESFLIAVAIMGVILIVLRVLKRKMRCFLDHIFFLDQLDLSKNLSLNAQKLNSTHELETFVFQLVASIQEIVKADVLDVWISQRQHHRFASYYSKRSKIALAFDDSFSGLIMDRKNIDGVIFFDELAKSKKKYVQEIFGFLQKHKAAGLMILKNAESKIIGIVTLGYKKTKEPYLVEEIEAIKKLIHLSQYSLGSIIYWHETIEGVKIRLKEQEYEQTF